MKTVKHIVKDGSREHVVWWDSAGAHCSEPNCEINQLLEQILAANAPTTQDKEGGDGR